MRLRSLDRGQFGIFKYNTSLGRFKVVRKEPEDRASGSTEIQYLIGGRLELHVWDISDPEVEELHDTDPD